MLAEYIVLDTNITWSRECYILHIASMQFKRLFENRPQFVVFLITAISILYLGPWNTPFSQLSFLGGKNCWPEKGILARRDA